MIRFRNKLALFNLVSKFVFAAAFLIIMPWVLERFNLLQTDLELIEKREWVIDLIEQGELDPLNLRMDGEGFGSYNILKEEYISLEPVELVEHYNFIDVSPRIVDDETIDYRVLSYSFLIDGQTYLLEIGKSLSSIVNTERYLRRITFYFLLLFVVISLVSDVSFARILIRPLEDITRKFRNKNNPAEYKAAPVQTSTYEFQYLDKTLDEMMQQIQELFQKEKQYTANISHELLTPVSILRSTLENLLLNHDLDDAAAAKVEESLKILHRLKSLVNALMMIARIESSQYLKTETAEIQQLLDDVSSELIPLIEDREILLQRNYSLDYTLTKVNKTLLFTMFYNVLNNAIKFTPRGGTIILSATTIGSDLLVEVADNGSGIQQEQLEKLFKRFSVNIPKEGNGTGLGLAITKSIADFHGVRMNVVSQEAKGVKLSFIFHRNS